MTVRKEGFLQHFLGLRLGGRQEAGSEARRGEDGDADFLHREILAEAGRGP